MVIRINDKNQNYNNVTKLLVKPFKFKGLKNSQHIILVKGGGYLLNEDGSDVDKSNLQDGDRIITVKQAKEIEKASYLEDED